MPINTDLNEGMKYKPSRIFMWFIIIVIACVFLHLGFNGNHNKMPGFETNISNNKSENQTDTSKITATINDTAYPPINFRERKNEKQSLPKKKSEISQKPKYDIHDNNFDAPTQIGDGNIQNNGIIPRVIPESMMFEFSSIYPNRSIKISFTNFGSSDGEMENVKNQIITLLKKSGYNDIDDSWNITFGTIPDEIQSNPYKIIFSKNSSVEATFFIASNSGN